MTQTNPKFEVVVGNVGIVYSGNNYMQAQCKYDRYVRASKRGDGRVAGESVTLMHNGDIRMEHAGEVVVHHAEIH